MSLKQAYNLSFQTSNAYSIGASIQTSLINGQSSLLTRSKCWHIFSFGAVALFEATHVVKKVCAVAEVALRGLMNILEGVFTFDFDKIKYGAMDLFLFSPFGALTSFAKDLPLSILNVARSILFPNEALENASKRLMGDFSNLAMARVEAQQKQLAALFSLFGEGHN